jgi:hypothetical protein
MKTQNKNLNNLFLIFLIFTFFLGLYVYVSGGLTIMKEGMTEEDSNDNIDNKECPDMLINKGDSLLLLNSKDPNDPGIPFFNLEEYINYLEIQRKKGINCPILYLQKEINTQGNEVYRIRPSLFDQEGGLPIHQTTQTDPNKPLEVLDATRDNPPYNKGTYSGFDPLGLHVGTFTELDKIHYSTEIGTKTSDNPMDPNWGGVLYTEQSILSGKYDDYNITKPNYPTPKGTINPNLYAGDNYPRI